MDGPGDKITITITLSPMIGKDPQLCKLLGSQSFVHCINSKSLSIVLL